MNWIKETFNKTTKYIKQTYYNIIFQSVVCVHSSYNFFIKLFCNLHLIKLAKLTFNIKSVFNDLIKRKLKIDEETDFCFQCEEGNLNVIKFLLEHNPNISGKLITEGIFYNICNNGHSEIADLILEVNRDININIMDETIFRSLCKNNNYESVKWLYTKSLELNRKIDITTRDNEALKNAYESGNIKLLYYIVDLYNDNNIKNNDYYNIIKKI